MADSGNDGNNGNNEINGNIKNNGQGRQDGAVCSWLVDFATMTDHNGRHKVMIHSSTGYLFSILCPANWGRRLITNTTLNPSQITISPAEDGPRADDHQSTYQLTMLPPEDICIHIDAGSPITSIGISNGPGDLLLLAFRSRTAPLETFDMVMGEPGKQVLAMWFCGGRNIVEYMVEGEKL